MTTLSGRRPLWKRRPRGPGRGHLRGVLPPPCRLVRTTSVTLTRQVGDTAAGFRQTVLQPGLPENSNTESMRPDAHLVIIGDIQTIIGVVFSDGHATNQTGGDGNHGDIIVNA